MEGPELPPDSGIRPPPPLFPLPHISGDPSPRWHQLAAKPRRSNNSVCTRIYRTPDISLPGAFSGGSKGPLSGLPAFLIHSYLHRDHRTILLSSPALQFLSLALQAFLSQLAIAPVWREGNAARSVQERGSEKSEAQRTAWRRRRRQLANGSSEVLVGEWQPGLWTCLIPGGAPRNLRVPGRAGERAPRARRLQKAVMDGCLA